MSQILAAKMGVASRGLVYRCQHCPTVPGYTGEKRRVISHMYKCHIPLDQAPYYCTVCLFRCTDESTLLRHVKTYDGHRQKMAEMAARGNPTTDTAALLKSLNPHIMREGVDYVRLDHRTSEEVWSNRVRQPTARPAPVTAQEGVTNILDDILAYEQDGFSPFSGAHRPSTATTTPATAAAPLGFGVDSVMNTPQHRVYNAYSPLPPTSLLYTPTPPALGVPAYVPSATRTVIMTGLDDTSAHKSIQTDPLPAG